jgi:hypothetical protein
VEPGTVLADRYVVEDLLAEEGDSNSWRARDRILARSVVLQILPSDSAYAEELLTAAKRPPGSPTHVSSRSSTPSTTASSSTSCASGQPASLSTWYSPRGRCPLDGRLG